MGSRGREYLAEDNTLENNGGCIKFGDFMQGPTVRKNFCELINGATGSNSAAFDLDGGSNQGSGAKIIDNIISTGANASPLLSNLRINNAVGTYVSRNELERHSGAPANIVVTSSAVGTTLDTETYVPATDNYPLTWTDAGTNTTVVSRCEPYVLNGSSLTSASNSQNINLFQHPAAGLVVYACPRRSAGHI